VQEIGKKLSCRMSWQRTGIEELHDWKQQDTGICNRSSILAIQGRLEHIQVVCPDALGKHKVIEERTAKGMTGMVFAGRATAVPQLQLHNVDGRLVPSTATGDCSVRRLLLAPSARERGSVRQPFPGRLAT